MILRFLIKAVGYVFGLIITVWRSLFAMEERSSSLTVFLIRDTPGASSKISLLHSLLSATSLSPIFHNVPFSQYTPPYGSRTCLTNTPAKHSS